MRPDAFPEPALPHSRPDSSGSHATLILTGAYLGLCVLLGGGTRQGLPAEAVLQLLALPLIVHGLVRWSARPRSTAARLALAWAVLVPVGFLLQCLPLPPSLWTTLGGRAELVEELQAAGVAVGWHALSLDPDASLRAALAWLPPLALGLLTLGLHRTQQVRLLQGVLVIALASAVLGQGATPEADELCNSSDEERETGQAHQRASDAQSEQIRHPWRWPGMD